MKKIITICLLLVTGTFGYSQGKNEDPSFASSSNLKISETTVRYDDDLEQLVFSIKVDGTAGESAPKAAGKMDGAPVLGYVFPTTLKSVDVGFSATDGIVALALTSHPDFDDTPLWDEDNDRNYGNDGVIWHAHWVVLQEDKRVPGGLAVKHFHTGNKDVVLPPTNPGMPMYMDSPGFSVLTRGNEILVIVPSFRMNRQTSFIFDAVAAYMEVNTSKADYPMLGVYAVYSVASGDLSLPYTVNK